MNVLDPLFRLLSSPYIRLGSLRLHLRMSPDVSLLTPYTRLAIFGNAEVTTLELDIAYHDAEKAGERLWEVEDWAIRAQAAPLTSLTVRMDFSDVSLIKAQWGELVELTIGSPAPGVVSFGARDAINVLRGTRNLERCTIEFDSCETRPGGLQQQPVHLSMLKSLTLSGTSPSVSFASLLLMPSITHLSLAQRKSDDPEEKNTSAVANLVDRYGRQLTHVAFSYPSLDPDSSALCLELPHQCLASGDHCEGTSKFRYRHRADFQPFRT
ncbi:hypothetical protein FA13DRAFT_97151 [Coprinellus micaceus]|uniref:Uncharacterized protein n=1 Tax=Coprinellus micaceus TaxID=71717 RepID=A0A4Y7SIA9_COPMI|nr:hypothetical protein FA13DRAFT_97151 [Coprinellus micaceus]